MDTKAMTISLVLATVAIIFVLAENVVLIAISTVILLWLMVDGIASMYKEVKAIMERGDLNDWWDFYSGAELFRSGCWV